MFTIGEFSKITGLTVKTLRFYHEEQLLVPSFVDPQTGYRYYDDDQIETARLIIFLRDMDFPLADIKPILVQAADEQALLQAVERQRDMLQNRIKHFKRIVRSLDQFLSEEKEARIMAETAFQIEEKNLEPAIIVAIRMRGRYRDCGKGFGQLGRTAGRHMCGKPFMLHYDTEYKEDDADFEVCMPVTKQLSANCVASRQLPGGHCVSLLHKGPYETLGRSYARIIDYIKDHGYAIVMPTREVYIKGPGMIFRGNPKNYLTEIQMLVQERRPA